MPRGRPRGRRGRGRGHTTSSQQTYSSDSDYNSADVDQPPVRVAHPDQLRVGPLAGAEHPPVLHLQANHRAQAIIDGDSPPALSARHHMVKLKWHNRYKPYLIKAGLYGVHQIGHIPADARLVTALVERWRVETHTFHLPIGEATVTLEDVAILLGLPIDGKPVCVNTNRDWSFEVEDLLGRALTPATFKSRCKMRFSWLNDNFASLPDPENADETTVQYYARAYMLALVGSVLFTDNSGDCVSAIYLPLFRDFDMAGKYSWGSAVLAFLYRELCLATSVTRKQLDGPLILLQMWSWEKFPIGRPKPRGDEPQLGGDDNESRPPFGFKWSGHHEFADNSTCKVTNGYRDNFDLLTDDSKVNWRPYEQQKHLLPPVCTDHSNLWMTTAPLIHFWIVEKCNPERVMRQFGLYQSFPPYFRDTDSVLHRLKHGRGRDWCDEHAEYLAQWEERWDNVVREDRPYELSTIEDYKRWLSGFSLLRLQTSRMRSADQPFVNPRLLHYQKIVPDLRSAAEKIWEMTRGAAQLLGAWDEHGAKTFMHNVLSAGKSALEDLGEFTALDGTFHALDEEHHAENEGGEDLPEDPSAEVNGSQESQTNMAEDELEVHSGSRNNVTPVRPDEAGPSRPLPKRTRYYRGG